MSLEFFTKTIQINPKVLIVFNCFLKLNCDIHQNTIIQFINLLDFIICILLKSKFNFKSEFISKWKIIKLKVQQKNEKEQIIFIEEFIDHFILCY